VGARRSKCRPAVARNDTPRKKAEGHTLGFVVTVSARMFSPVASRLYSPVSFRPSLFARLFPPLPSPVSRLPYFTVRSARNLDYLAMALHSVPS
jgi:hypothetical protein